MEKHKILNWTAKVTGFLIAGFFLLFFVGEGLPDIVNGKGKELLIFLPFALPALIGYVIAWRLPVKGGRLMIVGALLMAGYLFYFNDVRAVLIYGIPTVAVGLCFLAQVEKNFYNKDMRLQSENLTRRTDFFTHIKYLIHRLSVKPEIFSVSEQAAQYFLYLRRPPKSMGKSFQKLKNQYNYG